MDAQVKDGIAAFSENDSVKEGILIQDLNFSQISAPREYPFTFIYGITQDLNGYMWIIASQMLYKYDGYKFTIYKNEPSNPNSMAGIRPECIYADKKGFIWIGHSTAGLDKLDPSTGIFTHYRHLETDSTTLSCDFVRAIAEDHNGMVWVGTDSGLNQLDPKTGKFMRYMNNPADKESLSWNNVRVVYVDHQGIIWVGTGTPWANQDPSSKPGGLNKFNPVTGKFMRYVHDPDDSTSIIDNRVSAICEDSKGNFWVGTAGDGLHLMDRTTGKFTRLRADPLHPEKLSRPPVRYFSWADDYITFIKEDVAGSIWIGTLAAGMNRYNPLSKKITHFESLSLHGPRIRNRIGYFQSYSSAKDGELWISSWEGELFKIDPLTKPPPYRFHFRTFRCFLRTSQGDLLMGSPYGVYFHEPGLDRDAILLSHDSKNSRSISNNNVHCIFEDHNKDVWVGTDSGLNLFNSKDKSFIHFLHESNNKKSLQCDIVYSVCEDPIGNLWVGTSRGLGMMNGRKNQFEWYNNFFENGEDGGSNFIKCMLIDKNQNFWIGSWSGGGVSLFNATTKKFTHYLKGSFITSLFEDSKGVIWAGTNTAVFTYDAHKGEFRRFLNERVLINQAYVNSIIEDRNKNLWISSYSGFTKINPERSASITYANNLGMDVTDLLDYGGYADRTGRLYFGDNYGYYSFLPEECSTNTFPPILHLTRLSLKSKNLQNDNDSASTIKFNYDSTGIKLAHIENSFSLDFVGIHYSHPEANKLFYKLDNFENGWHEAYNTQSANYANIPPGKYMFRMKARSSNGVWSEMATPLTIRSPWWNHWLLKALITIITIYVLSRLIRRQMNLNFRAKLDKLEKEKQLAALKHKSSELEMQVLRTQMNPHFIFNSLNSINRFILQNNKGQASQYLTKFSKLIRLILQNSQAELISLESELESLELYLDLESLRFDYHFNYKISVQNDLDISNISVPPLIIQPYAENAIWHGLMHKEEKGQLDIDISEENDNLVCRVSDNGIGRKKAEELGSKTATRHKSMGLHITADRIALIQKEQDMGPAVKILDLMNADGTAAGTEITITLPLIYG
jgi:ligand-binding sensor domain-containing protein